MHNDGDLQFVVVLFGQHFKKGTSYAYIATSQPSFHFIFCNVFVDVYKCKSVVREGSEVAAPIEDERIPAMQ